MARMSLGDRDFFISIIILWNQQMWSDVDRNVIMVCMIILYHFKCEDRRK